jgi:hypothetical protein
MDPRTKSPTAVSRVVAERQDFKFLLAANPNYFGNLEASPYKLVKKIVGNVTYEELSQEVITRGVHR